MMQSCFIPIILPSLNEYINVCRSNKFGAAKYKVDIENQISLFLRLQPVTKPVKVDFYWIERNQKRDCDNIASAKKFILDALVKKGVLPDDNQKWVKGLEDHFAVDKDNYGVQIVLKEMEP